MKFLQRTNAGELILSSFHPKSSPTWHWAVYLRRRNPNSPGIGHISRAETRRAQWHDYYRAFGWELIVSHQDFHLQGWPS